MPAKKDERFYLYKGRQRRPLAPPISETASNVSTSFDNSPITVSVLLFTFFMTMTCNTKYYLLAYLGSPPS